MQQDAMPGLQILLTDVCPHAVLPQDCSSCQMQAFNAINQQSDTPLLKDIQRSLIHPLVQNGQTSYTLDFRYAADHEAQVEDELSDNTSDYDALVPTATVFKPKKTTAERIEAYRQQSAQFGVEPDAEVEKNITLDDNQDDEDNDRPSQLPEDLKRLRIVFIGPLEAYLGFIFCLLSKYCNTTLMITGMDVGAGPEIHQMIRNRWHWEGDMDRCLFQRHEEAIGYIKRVTDGSDGDDFMSTTNLHQFVAGYKKMRETTITGVVARSDGGSWVYAKSPSHSTECHQCMSIDEEIGDGTRGQPLDDFAAKTECKAYWYFL